MGEKGGAIKKTACEIAYLTRSIFLAVCSQFAKSSVPASGQKCRFSFVYYPRRRRRSPPIIKPIPRRVQVVGSGMAVRDALATLPTWTFPFFCP